MFTVFGFIDCSCVVSLNPWQLLEASFSTEHFRTIRKWALVPSEVVRVHQGCVSTLSLWWHSTKCGPKWGLCWAGAELISASSSRPECRVEPLVS